VLSGKLLCTFQDPNLHLLCGSVGDYLAGASATPVAAPLGLESRLNDDLLAAPHWVRQLAVFAAAISASADLTILDEPLDGVSLVIPGQAAIELMRAKVSRGQTVLLITHNPNLAKVAADEYLWVSNGHLHHVSAHDASAHRELSEWLGARRE